MAPTGWSKAAEECKMALAIKRKKETTGNKSVLAGLLSWLECCPVHKNVVGLIPGPDTYLDCRFDPWSGPICETTHQCFSYPCFFFVPLSLPLSLKLINISSGED